MRLWVRLRVFILIYLLLPLDLYFESYISLILVLILVFIYFRDQFSILISNIDFSVNSNSNSVIFYLVDSYWSYLSQYTKITNFLSQFIV